MPIIRKLIKQGRDNLSYTITLPKSWIEYHESKGGTFEKIEIEVDGELLIQPHYPEKEE